MVLLLMSALAGTQPGSVSAECTKIPPPNFAALNRIAVFLVYSACELTTTPPPFPLATLPRTVEC